MFAVAGPSLKPSVVSGLFALGGVFLGFFAMPIMEALKAKNSRVEAQRVALFRALTDFSESVSRLMHYAGILRGQSVEEATRAELQTKVIEAHADVRARFHAIPLVSNRKGVQESARL